MKIIKYLESFNRKERFHLVGQLLGNSAFNLDPKILRNILDLLGLASETPKDCFSAMDYHLDWIYASIVLAHDKSEAPYLRNSLCISGTQEDVDFLLAFEDKYENTHIVMIEAKGDTSFTNKQIQSKANRLNAIFGDGEKWEHVIPHFLICSPHEPKQLNLNNFPCFMTNKDKKLIWFKLTMPENQNKPTRCHLDGKASKEGDYWKVDTLR